MTGATIEACPGSVTKPLKALWYNRGINCGRYSLLAREKTLTNISDLRV